MCNKYMNYPRTALIVRIKQAIKISFIARAIVVCVMLSHVTSAHAGQHRTSGQEKILNVITSIKPIQWMVQDIVGDTEANIDVLLEDSQSQYLRTLKPSQQHKLSSADVVFYIHEDFEVFLKQSNALDTSKSISFGTLPYLRLLALRKSGAMPYVVEPASTETKQSIQHPPVDWRIWLSPENAILMLKKITYVLSDLNPDKAMAYKSNFFIAKNEILTLVKTTAAQLKPVLNKPFIVLQDDYQYFEEQYGLQSKATVSTQSVSSVNKLIQAKNINVMLKELRHSNSSIKKIDKKVKIVELDSLGQGNTKQATSYVDFIRMFSNELIFGLLDD